MIQAFTVGFLGYMAALVAVGILFYKKSKTTSDFMLAGRSLNYWTTAIAAHASDMSLWMFMGLPAAAYATGIISGLIPLGLIAGMFITWKFIAAPLRIMTEQLHNNTLSDFFQSRFHDTKGQIRKLSAFVSLWFFTFYIASGLVGMGYVFEDVFHIDYHVGLLLGLAITVAYTFIGGFGAIAQSHFFQGIFLVIMMVLVPVLAFATLPSGSFIAALQGASTAKAISASSLFFMIFAAISWGMGYFGQPHILVNFMVIEDPKTMPKAMRVGMLWQLFTFASSLAVGLIGIAFFHGSLANSQLVFVEMVTTLFSPLLAGCILCSVLAAGLTTIATQMIVASSTVANDLYAHYWNPKATSDQIIRVSQYSLILVPLISFCVAFTKSSTVMNLVTYAWMGLGASFGPAIIAALYLPQATARGISLGMLLGGLTATIWPFITASVPALIPAFFVNACCIAYYRK